MKITREYTVPDLSLERLSLAGWQFTTAQDYVESVLVDHPYSYQCVNQEILMDLCMTVLTYEITVPDQEYMWAQLGGHYEFV